MYVVVILNSDNPVNLASDVSTGVIEALHDCGASTSQTSRHGGPAVLAQLSLTPPELSRGFYICSKCDILLVSNKERKV